MFISITFTETSIDETNKTQQKVRGSKFVHNVHHSREHMHSNDYAAAQSLMVSVAVSSLGDTPPHHLTAQQHTCKPPLVKAKAALRKQKKNKIWRKTIFKMADGILTPCNVACGSGIMTVNSPGGSTLQCDTWFWDHDIKFTRWQHLAMWQMALGCFYRCWQSTLEQSFT